MESKVAVVTGVGAGSVGEATATALRERGFRVLTSTRACATIEDAHALELTSRTSVAAYSGWVQTSTHRLDVLVNNAGVHLDLASSWHEPHLVDGREIHWRLNYLGTAQLTRLLIPLLLETAEEYGKVRVVNVVSRLHERGSNDGLDGHLSPYDSGSAYGTSKLALIHEAAQVEQRFGHPGAARLLPAPRGGAGHGRRTARAPAPRPAASTGHAPRASPRTARRRRVAHHGVVCHLARRRARWLSLRLRPRGALAGRSRPGGGAHPVGGDQPLGRARLTLATGRPHRIGS